MFMKKCLLPLPQIFRLPIIIIFSIFIFVVIYVINVNYIAGDILQCSTNKWAQISTDDFKQCYPTCTVEASSTACIFNFFA